MRYCNPKESYLGIDWSGQKNIKELHHMLERTVMIRRLKSDVLTQLPAKRRQKICIATGKWDLIDNFRCWRSEEDSLDAQTH